MCLSREAAQECSPGRKPWVRQEIVESPEGAKDGQPMLQMLLRPLINLQQSLF